MKKTVIAVLILAAAAAIFVLLPGDEKKIRSNLDSLAGYLSTTETDKSLATLQKVSKAGKLCSDPCAVQFQSFNIDRNFDRKELTDHILMMKKMLPGTRFSFHDTSMNFPKEDRADITTTLRLTGKIESDQFTDAYEFAIIAEKIEGKWLFSSFTVVEFMEQ